MTGHTFFLENETRPCSLLIISAATCHHLLMATNNRPLLSASGQKTTLPFTL